MLDLSGAVFRIQVKDLSRTNNFEGSKQSDAWPTTRDLFRLLLSSDGPCSIALLQLDHQLASTVAGIVIEAGLIES
jgi:hypothetical protein